MTALDDRGWRGAVDQPERTLFDAAVESELLADDTIEARFQAFRRGHPEVYAALREIAFSLLDQGWEHFGISTCWEVVRYRTMLGAGPGEDRFKLNDNYKSRYARLLADQEPRLAEVFHLRALRSASHPPSGLRVAGECGACAAGHCRSCHGISCGHECDIERLL